MVSNPASGGTEQKAAAEERFFAALEKEVCVFGRVLPAPGLRSPSHHRHMGTQVAKVSNFTGTHVTQVQKSLLSLKEKVKADKDRKRTDEFLVEAGKIGDDFLELEKFVNLNYMVRCCEPFLRRAVGTIEVDVVRRCDHIPTGLPQDPQEARQNAPPRPLPPVLHRPPAPAALGAGQLLWPARAALDHLLGAARRQQRRQERRRCPGIILLHTDRCLIDDCQITHHHDRALCALPPSTGFARRT